MNLLLDTHILLWALTNDPRLPEKARELIQNPDNNIYFSIISPWEVEIKRMAHPQAMPIGAEELVIYCLRSGFQELPLWNNHINLLKSLTRGPSEAPHQDPFDRIMICQSMAENMLFITHDKNLSGYHEPSVLVV